MEWNVYLSGEIHTDWRDQIKRGCEALDLPIRFTSAVTDHPASVNESYNQHLQMASGFGIRLILAGLACLVHAILPFAFEKTGSRMIADLYLRMVSKRVQGAGPDAGVAALSD